MTQLGFKHSDLVAAKKLLDIHMAKLEKAIVVENYAEACSALRATQDECNNAISVAASLSLGAHLQHQRR